MLLRTHFKSDSRTHEWASERANERDVGTVKFYNEKPKPETQKKTNYSEAGGSNLGRVENRFVDGDCSPGKRHELGRTKKTEKCSRYKFRDRYSERWYID